MVVEEKNGSKVASNENIWGSKAEDIFEMTEEEYLKGLETATSAEEALKQMHKLYGESGSLTDFCQPKVNISWDIVYATLATEHKFDIHAHWATAFAVMTMMKPKLIALWSKSGNTTNRAEMGDYISECLLQLSTLLEVRENEKGKIVGFNPDYNDNLCPFTETALRTIYNEISAPEITPYLQKKYGYRMSSLDEALDDEDRNFQVPDVKRTPVDSYVTAKISAETSGVKIREILHSNASIKKKITDISICNDLGLSDEELNRLVPKQVAAKDTEEVEAVASEEEAEEEEERMAI